VGPSEAICHSEAISPHLKSLINKNIKCCRWEDGAWRFKCSFTYEEPIKSPRIITRYVPTTGLYTDPRKLGNLIVKTCAPAHYQHCVGWSWAHGRQESEASEVGKYQSLYNKVRTGQKMGLLPSHVRHATSHSRPDYCISVSKYQ